MEGLHSFIPWFCGTTNQNFTSHILKQEWNKTSIMENYCVINIAETLIHGTFGIVAVLVLLILGYVCGFKRNSSFLVRFPGHIARWSLMLILLNFTIASISEGILTASNFSRLQPHLIVPQLTIIVSTSIMALYSLKGERWLTPRFCYLMLLYWISSMCIQFVRLEFFTSYDLNHYKKSSRYAFSTCYIALLLLLIFVEIYTLLKKVWFPTRSFLPWRIPEDIQRGDVHFQDQYTNFLSKVSYWWLNWLFFEGLKEPLKQQSLGSLPLQHSPEALHSKFKHAYDYISKKKKKNQFEDDKHVSLWWVYLRVSGSSLLWAAFLRLMADTLGYVGPLGVKGLVNYANNFNSRADLRREKTPHFLSSTEFLSNGFVLLGIILGCSIVKLTMFQFQQYILFTTGLHLRASLQAMVYEKALHLSTYSISRGRMTLGQITNHMAVDVDQIMLLFQNFNSIWAIPLQLCVTLILLFMELGSSSLLGTSVLLIIVPIQLVIGGKMAGIQKRILTWSDLRLKKCNELLEGVKVLKLYGWENIFADGIQLLRQKEMRNIIKFNVAFLLILVITSSAPLLTTIIAFGTYSSFSGNPLTPGKAFAALALFNQMSAPIFLFPLNLTFLVNAMVSTRRIEAFLSMPEVSQLGDEDHKQNISYDEVDPMGDFSVELLQPDIIPLCQTQKSNGKRMQKDAESHPLIAQRCYSLYGTQRVTDIPKLVITKSADLSASNVNDDIAIKIENASFAWDEEEKQIALSGINVEIPKGKLTVIIGGIGTGKSSLLSAIMGEMTAISGSVQFLSGNSEVAYSSQTAWLLNTSIQQNIVFGNPVRGRDQQKRYRRVLAVCCLDPDLHILPAGDQTEIGEKGITLSGGQKQRISLARAFYSNKEIVILDDPFSALDVHVRAEIFQKGIKRFLLKEDRTVILVTHHQQYVFDADKVIVMKNGRIAQQGHPDDLCDSNPNLSTDWSMSTERYSSSDKESDSDCIWEERRSLKTQVQRLSFGRKIKGKVTSVSTISLDKGKLMEEEERAIGSVSFLVYMFYFKSVSYWLCLLILALLLVRSALAISVNVWLSKWSEAGLNTSEVYHTTSYFVSGYIGLSGILFIGMLVSSICLTAGTLIAAQQLFINMLRNIIKVPMRFFDITPVGRVLNRFSSDTNRIDTRLPQTFTSFLSILVLIVAAAVMNTIINPFFLVLAIPLSAAFLGLLAFYIRTSRELQRLVSVTRSPILAFFSETLNGLQTVRAFKHESRFYHLMMEKIADNTICFLYLITARRWLGFRLDLLGALIVFAAGLSTLLGALFLGVEASYVGLGFTFALQVSLYLNEMVKNLADLELQMNAVERVKYYTEVEQEDDNGSVDVPHDWPQRGKVTYDHVWARYSKELDPVVKNLSVEVKPARKVGICGRTGSGKTSFTMALFRMIDTFKGRIMIDGVNIADVPLLTLRSRLSIIPQDPVLFNGTIRFNLDPKSKKRDDELWRALEIAQLKDLVVELDGGLESTVTEGGNNFSVGQRQLFCLARAFLRSSTILVMDEATASIDKETDLIVRDIVASSFKHRTVLTIAHRISSIFDSDTIMVLKEGRLAEYGSPQTLKTQRSSLFYELVKASA